MNTHLRYRITDNKLVIYLPFNSHDNTVESVILPLPLEYVDDVEALINAYQHGSHVETDDDN